MAADFERQVMVRMTAAMHEAVKAHSRQEERTMAQTIRRAVRLYLSAQTGADES